jgi:hypothetical protein
MSAPEPTDRADATVWLPLLAILGGVAERVARRRPDPDPTDLDPALPITTSGRGGGGDTRPNSIAGDRSGRGGRP